MSHLVSAALHNGIRFLLSPLPARLWALLTRSFPLQETYRLTMFRTKDNSRFRFSLFAGSVECPCEEISKPLDLATVPFWLKPVSLFGLLCYNDVYQEFASANHAEDPGPSLL